MIRLEDRPGGGGVSESNEHPVHSGTGVSHEDTWRVGGESVAHSGFSAVDLGTVGEDVDTGVDRESQLPAVDRVDLVGHREAFAVRALDEADGDQRRELHPVMVLQRILTR